MVIKPVKKVDKGELVNGSKVAKAAEAENRTNTFGKKEKSCSLNATITSNWDRSK